jgi:hypothetical protein
MTLWGEGIRSRHLVSRSAEEDIIPDNFTFAIVCFPFAIMG